LAPPAGITSAPVSAPATAGAKATLAEHGLPGVIDGPQLFAAKEKLVLVDIVPSVIAVPLILVNTRFGKGSSRQLPGFRS
jgi:hypothetical protein